jgi:hypothetical protein
MRRTAARGKAKAPGLVERRALMTTNGNLDFFLVWTAFCLEAALYAIDATCAVSVTGCFCLRFATSAVFPERRMLLPLSSRTDMTSPPKSPGGTVATASFLGGHIILPTSPNQESDGTCSVYFWVVLRIRVDVTTLGSLYEVWVRLDFFDSVPTISQSLARHYRIDEDSRPTSR